MSPAVDGSALPAARGRRLGWGVLAVSVLVFLAQAVPMAREFPLWNEQAATVPGPIVLEIDSTRIDESGPLPTQPSCEAARLVYGSQRPNLKLCTTDARGRAFGWPILVSPYASGVAIWPLGLVPWLLGPSYILVRTLGLVVGVFSILLTYDLVSRLSGVRRAAATVAMASVSSPLLFACASAAYFETVPPLLALLAILLLVRAKTPGPSAVRSAAAGLLFGLALAGNLKMIVVLTTILGLALLFRAPVLHAGRRVLGFGALGVILGFGPILVFMVTDPFGEVFRVSDKYFTVMLHRLSPVFVWMEIKNILVSAVDLTYYLELASGAEAQLPPLVFLLAAALALLFSIRALVHAARGEPTDVSVASSITILLIYLVFVALFYSDQVPHNYAPVQLAFSPCLAISLVEAGEWLGRGRTERRGDMISAAVVLAGVLFFAMSTNFRSREWMHRFTSIDVRAEESIVSALHARGGHSEVPLVTLLYSHTGVFDALGATSAPSITIHPDLQLCWNESDRVACMVRRLERLLCPGGRLPLRFVFPIGAATRMDADNPSEIRDALWLATDRLGLGWTEEASALLPSGIGGLQLVRIDERASRLACPSSQ